MNTTTTYTRKEGLRRLTVLTKKLRAMGCVPFAGSFEIGERTHREVHPDGYQPGQQHPDDDLVALYTKDEYVKGCGLQHGEVVHIYVSFQTEYDGGLDGTYCGWVGGPDDEPMIVNCNGVEITPR